MRLFAPSETKAAWTQLGSGRFKTDDRDCAALTYLARQGARRLLVDELAGETLRASVRPAAATRPSLTLDSGRESYGR